jgi:hypothetical protein
VIAAAAAAATLRPEAHQPRMLLESSGGVLVGASDGTRRRILGAAGDAAYAPDGTLVAFARAGDLWLANADGTGQRQLTATPHVAEQQPAWSADGTRILYTALIGGKRQVRVVTLPAASFSTRLAPSDAEEWSPAVSSTGRLAFVSTRSGSPAIYVGQPDGTHVAPFDAVTPEQPPLDIRHLRWSPDGKRLLYTAVAADGSTQLVLDDGTTQTVLNAAGTVALRGTWSPGGTRIAYDDGLGHLSSVAADGTDQRSVGTGAILDWRVVPVGHPLFPNLVQRPPSGLVVTRSAGGRWLLGFTSLVDNRGPGALWIHGTRARGASVMRVRQLVQIVARAPRVEPRSGELRYVVAPPHYHWHMLGFDRYELRRASDFRLLVRDRKSGFCIADHYGIALGVPHGPPRFLGSCAQFDRRARFVEEGSSVGYTDRYPANFHGQNLDLTDVPAGRYWLVHRVNSDFHLRETRYDDDAASLLIRVDWPGGRRAPPAIATLRTCSKERCP